MVVRDWSLGTVVIRDWSVGTMVVRDLSAVTVVVRDWAVGTMGLVIGNSAGQGLVNGKQWWSWVGQ